MIHYWGFPLFGMNSDIKLLPDLSERLRFQRILFRGDSDALQMLDYSQKAMPKPRDALWKALRRLVRKKNLKKSDLTNSLFLI